MSCPAPTITGDDKETPITILQRPKTFSNDLGLDSSRIVHPRLPFHKRWEIYIRKRNEIFNVSSICHLSRPKRSTVRLRNFFKVRKLCRNIRVSTIVSNPKDMRYYAKVSFLDFEEYGLLDTGANISCIGGNLAQKDFSKYSNFRSARSHARTADGSTQNVLGWIDVEVTFRGSTRCLRFLIIPSITQNLILGIDFWKSFDLIRNLICTSEIGRAHV